MSFSTFDAYLAAHKQALDEQAAATKRASDAEAGLHDGIARGFDHDTLMELAKKSKDADLQKDAASKAVDGLKKANPGWEEERVEQGRPGPAREAAGELLEGAKVETAYVVYQVIDAVKDLAAAALGGAGISPPVIDPNIPTKAPPGSLLDNAQVAVKLLKDDAKELGASATQVLAEAIAAGRDVRDAAIGALPEPLRIAAGGTPEEAIAALGQPAEAQNRAQAAANELDALGPAQPLLSQYAADFHDGIANGASPAEAERDASAKLHESLTGEAFAEPHGVHDAVRGELEKRYGEQTKHVYEDMLSHHLEQEQQRGIAPQGISR